MSTQLTETLIKGLTPPVRGERYVYDAEVTGFALKLFAPTTANPRGVRALSGALQFGDQLGDELARLSRVAARQRRVARAQPAPAGTTATASDSRYKPTVTDRGFVRARQETLCVTAGVSRTRARRPPTKPACIRFVGASVGVCAGGYPPHAVEPPIAIVLRITNLGSRAVLCGGKNCLGSQIQNSKAKDSNSWISPPFR